MKVLWMIDDELIIDAIVDDTLEENDTSLDRLIESVDKED